jgi:hypothetical protein
MAVWLAQCDDGDDEHDDTECGEEKPYEPLCSAPPRGERCDVNHRGEIILRFRVASHCAAAAGWREAAEAA